MSDKTGDVDYYLSQSGLDSEREKEIGRGHQRRDPDPAQARRRPRL